MSGNVAEDFLYLYFKECLDFPRNCQITSYKWPSPFRFRFMIAFVSKVEQLFAMGFISQ